MTVQMMKWNSLLSHCSSLKAEGAKRVNLKKAEAMSPECIRILLAAANSSYSMCAFQCYIDTQRWLMEISLWGMGNGKVSLQDPREKAIYLSQRSRTSLLSGRIAYSSPSHHRMGKEWWRKKWRVTRKNVEGIESLNLKWQQELCSLLQL